MPRSTLPRESRSEKLDVRVKPAQRRKVKRAARAAGITVSAYLSEMIDNKPQRRMVADAPADLVPYPLLAQWQRAGNNVNQIARGLHRGRDVDAAWITAAMKDLLTLMVEDQITRRFALKFGARRLLKRFAVAG